MPIQPRPIADTRRPVRPSARWGNGLWGFAGVACMIGDSPVYGRFEPAGAQVYTLRPVRAAGSCGHGKAPAHFLVDSVDLAPYIYAVRCIRADGAGFGQAQDIPARADTQIDHQRSHFEP